MHRRVSNGIKQTAAIATCHSAKTHRRVVWPEHGRAYLGDTFLLDRRRNSQTVDIAKLALIGSKTQRGIAFNVLYRFKALATGDLDSSSCDIVLKIDELLGCLRRGFCMGNVKDRHPRGLLTALCLRDSHISRHQGQRFNDLEGRIPALFHRIRR